MLALRWIDVDLEGDRPSVTISGTVTPEPGKGTHRKPSSKSDASMRTVTIPGFAVAVLMRRQSSWGGDPGAPVFPTRNGAWHQVTNVERRWRAGYHRHMTILTRAADDQLEAAACLFHGFSGPSRIAILRQLALGEHRVTDLVAHLGLAQSTVSKHLACLKDCGLVESRPVGRASVFSLTHPEALDALFAAAERLLLMTGEAVVLCADYGAATLRADPPSAATTTYREDAR